MPTAILPATEPRHCFHCGQPIPPGSDFHAWIAGRREAMCCPGCLAVAEGITAAGLDAFYRYRDQPSPRVAEAGHSADELALFDAPDIAQQFVQPRADGRCEIALSVEGLVCPACAWLSEQALHGLAGVTQASVNYTTRRARLHWDPRVIKLSEILHRLRRLGYTATPYDPARHEQSLDKERRTLLAQLGVAAALGMQVMMVAFALYTSAETGIEAEYADLLNWLNFALTVPVVAYSGLAFFRPAWRDLRQRRVGMDVSVAAAILLAFGGSVWATMMRQGPGYYDSVTMFVLFLLVARYCEFMARKRACDSAESLFKLTPQFATRLSGVPPDRNEERVAVAQLRPDDIVLIRPGETIPADGRVAEGQSSADESLITGEALPIAKTRGARLIGGSINVESPLHMRVEQVGESTLLAQILRVWERAQSEKPIITLLADRIAGGFMLAVLALAFGVALYGIWAGTPDWFARTLAVLVVTCPCALSLAMPAAIAAAGSRLIGMGILMTRGDALERLARATHFIFDKTGTLTDGRLTLAATRPLSRHAAKDCLAIAAVLEQSSEHPIAHAIRAAAPAPTAPATAVSNTPGRGISGVIDGVRYYLGTPAFIAERTRVSIGPAGVDTRRTRPGAIALLATEAEPLAAFLLADELRADVPALIAGLQQARMHVSMLSGDRLPAVQATAAMAGIHENHAALVPEQKLRIVEQLQSRGARVVMVGDGVNDAPVLAAAGVSIAMGSGADLTRASADFVLLHERIGGVLEVFFLARRTLGIIRQNLGWALLYNSVSLPLAATGSITPWLAALGMAGSSLIVVLNALRLARH